ncbi:MAG: GntR family transcriptional regulator [Candidatus Omnitrophica bacterium]|nr:GntR family transcriptional regulator [Candidatus Omnitrophota bacterium]
MEFKFLIDEKKTKYNQVKSFIIDYIDKKKLKTGDRVPSENEIAQSFGITKVTASRALNELVNEGILYRIQGKGSFFAGYKTKVSNILLFFPIVSSYDPYFTGPLLETFFHSIDDRGLNLSMFYFRENERIREIPDIKNCKVIIVAALKKGEGLSDELLEKINIPVIYLSSHPEVPVSYVAFDNKKGAKKAVEYLIKMGHRKIAYFSADYRQNISNEERMEGYIEALNENGIRHKIILNGDYTEESGYKLAKEILEMKERPTAILTCNDLVAIGAIHCFFENNIKVPDDISIIGFGNYKISNYTRIPLTTVSLPVKEMGRKLAELAVKKIYEKTLFKNESVIIPTELIIRKSVKKIC